MPGYFRVAAVALLAITILAIGFAFYSSRNQAAFRLKSEHTRLSTEVVAEINGYERLETDGNVSKYYVKADKAITYSDNHQEMQNIYLQVFDETGTRSDKLTAEKALYVPEENKNFTAYLAGNVNIETRDALKIKTAQIAYTKSTESAETIDPVDFERLNVRGHSVGATVKIKEKVLELLQNVEIETFESPELAAANLKSGRITADSATFDQLNQVIEFRQNVAAEVLSADKTINLNSNRASAVFVSVDGKEPALSRLELFDAIKIRSVPNGGQATTIASEYALYDKPADRFELKTGVTIVTIEGERPTTIKADQATFEQKSGKIGVIGNAEITQGTSFLKGDRINAELYPNRKMKSAMIVGNGYLRQSASDRTTEISANELNATFGEDQSMRSANAVGSSNAAMTPVNAVEYSKVTLSSPRAIHLWFRGEGRIDRMQTDGRTTIQLNVPDNAPDSANKRLTADSVRTFFDESGKDLQKAEAIGNAELFVDPLRVSPENYKTTVSAPRFDCDFFPTGNNAKSCVAGVKTRTTRVPTQPSDDRGPQTITADRLTAVFGQQSKDIERLDATGNAKFSEADRNALAGRFEFTPKDGIVRLRGAEPTAWDSKARARASEIDWDTRNQRSYLRGKVSTTYYNQSQTGGAAPFAETEKPVYITANSAEFDHRAQTGRYTGNTRGWQADNFVRAENFFIDQTGGKFLAEGQVQSMLYNVKRRENGRDVDTPVYAVAQKLSYDRGSRVLHYENAVDIRQGNDRITANVANVYLNEKNEVSESVAENNVVITQPKRRATGSYAQYVSADESVLLRGNPATVEDAENGSSQAGEIRVFLRDNRVVGDGRTKQNSAGRMRSVYKVKNIQ